MLSINKITTKFSFLLKTILYCGIIWVKNAHVHTVSGAIGCIKKAEINSSKWIYTYHYVLKPGETTVCNHNDRRKLYLFVDKRLECKLKVTKWHTSANPPYFHKF